MNYGAPTVWDVLQKENDSTSDVSLTVIEASQAGGGSLGEKSLGPMTPEVAYMGRIAYGIVAPIIITFGIFTNILNLLVLTRPTLRGPTYRYLMWLAVANLLVCMTLLPFILHSHHTPVGYLAAIYLAHFEMPFGNALIASSVYIVVGLSIDRYVAVCHPRKYRNLHSYRVASIRIAFSFVIGFFIYIPMSFGKRVVRADGTREQFLPKENFGVTDTKWWIVYKCVLEICARFAPAVLLAFLNIWIIIEFKKVSQRRRLLTHNLTELSGFPSQSLAEVSQGTSQPLNRDEKEEACQSLSQNNDSKSAVYCLQKSERSVAKNKLLTIKEDEIKFPLASPIEMNSIHSENDMKMRNGDCRCTISFFNLKKIKSEDNNLSKSLHKNHSFHESRFSFDNKDIEFNGTFSDNCKDEQISKQKKPSAGELNDDKSNNATVEFASPTKSKILRKEECHLQEFRVASPTKSKILCEEACHLQEFRGTSKLGRVSCKPMSARRLDMERRLILLLVVIIIAFFLTNIPTAVLSLTFTENKRASLPYQIFRAIANNLEFLNFGLHFILYFLFSQDIRKTFMAILHRAMRHIFKKIFSSGTNSKIPNIT